MSASLRSAGRILAFAVVIVLLGGGPARAQQSLPSRPFAPEWGMLAGWDVFTSKGCGKCHALRGVGGGVGPDLARVQPGTTFFDIGAAMWNHLPRMGAKMREVGIDRPRLTPLEASNLIAFIFTAQYWDETGVPSVGARLFAEKACAECHTVGGKGAAGGRPLDHLKGTNSPVLVAAAMWNHGPQMAERMKAQGIERPILNGRQLADLVAYIVSAARSEGVQTTQVVPGTPARGEQLFGEKHCATCHAVKGKGGKVGPALGEAAHHVSLTEFAEKMWNHGPKMWAAMQQRGIAVPQLSGQEMADVVAYLYTSRYFDGTAGNPDRGATLVQNVGCLGCHAVRGKGGKVGGDFATSAVVGSPASLVAGMWNHSRYMEAAAEKRQVAWPTLNGGQLADISAYLGSLATGDARKAK